MLVLLFVALRFFLRGDLFYVLPCVILLLCFSVLLALRLPRLGKSGLILVFFVRCSICAWLDLSVSSSSWCLGRALTFFDNYPDIFHLRGPVEKYPFFFLFFLQNLLIFFMFFGFFLFVFLFFNVVFYFIFFFSIIFQSFPPHVHTRLSCLWQFCIPSAKHKKRSTEVPILTKIKAVLVTYLFPKNLLFSFGNK